MGDNDLRKQAQQAVEQASAIRSGQQQNNTANLRPSVPSNFGLNGAVNLRGPQSLSEGADLTNGTDFAADDGDEL